MTTRQTIVFIFAVLCAIPDFAGAQTAEPTATKKYEVRQILMPFNARMLAIDDAGDIVGQMAGAGFLYRPGDSEIGIWATPDGSGGEVIPAAMNGPGDVLVAFNPKDPRAPYWHTPGFIYSSHERTFRPFGMDLTKPGCPAGIVAYTNQGQFFCNARPAFIVVPDLGARARMPCRRARPR
jgi:hypothetical protein